MIRRPPRSTLDRSSAASDVYKRQIQYIKMDIEGYEKIVLQELEGIIKKYQPIVQVEILSLIHISEPTRPY